MRNNIMRLKKALLRLAIMMMAVLWAGAVPGAVMVSHAETVTVTAEASEVPQSAAQQPEDDGITFLFAFLGGILLLILFVVVVVVAVSASTPGVIDL